jgi:hypothetical protein
LRNPTNATVSGSQNVTGFIIDYFDGSVFNHDYAVMTGINLQGGLCVYMKELGLNNFAYSRDCSNAFPYLCQIRMV